MSADADGVRALAELPYIGATTARLLSEAGVPSPKTLRKIGAAEAYRRLRFRHGQRIAANWIFALETALTGLYWRDLPKARIAELRIAAKHIIAECSGASGDSPGVTALAALASLGLTSARMLAEAGISNPKALRKLGAVHAWRRLRFHYGRRVTVNWIYAIECALRGLHWRDLETARTTELKAAAKKIAAELDAVAKK